MIFQKTSFKDLFILKPQLKIDVRGYFFRVFCKKDFKNFGLKFNIVQINRSYNKKGGSIRGFHFQKKPMTDTKIVQCLRGCVIDFVIDLREHSTTYKKWFSVELSEKNKKIIYIPKGFAHGFQTLVNDCILEYFVDEFYSPQHESGIPWNDPTFQVNWPLKPTVISEKDKKWPLYHV